MSSDLEDGEISDTNPGTCHEPENALTQIAQPKSDSFVQSENPGQPSFPTDHVPVQRPPPRQRIPIVYDRSPSKTPKVPQNPKKANCSSSFAPASRRKHHSLNSEPEYVSLPPAKHHSLNSEPEWVSLPPAKHHSRNSEPEWVSLPPAKHHSRNSEPEWVSLPPAKHHSRNSEPEWVSLPPAKHHSRNSEPEWVSLPPANQSIYEPEYVSLPAYVPPSEAHPPSILKCNTFAPSVSRPRRSRRSSRNTFSTNITAPRPLMDIPLPTGELRLNNESLNTRSGMDRAGASLGSTGSGHRSSMNAASVQRSSRNRPASASRSGPQQELIEVSGTMHSSPRKTFGGKKSEPKTTRDSSRPGSAWRAPRATSSAFSFECEPTDVEDTTIASTKSKEKVLENLDEVSDTESVISIPPPDKPVPELVILDSDSEKDDVNTAEDDEAIAELELRRRVLEKYLEKESLTQAQPNQMQCMGAPETNYDSSCMSMSSDENEAPEQPPRIIPLSPPATDPSERCSGEIANNNNPLPHEQATRSNFALPTGLVPSPAPAAEIRMRWISEQMLHSEPNNFHDTSLFLNRAGFSQITPVTSTAYPFAHPAFSPSFPAPPMPPLFTRRSPPTGVLFNYDHRSGPPAASVVQSYTSLGYETQPYQNNLAGGGVSSTPSFNFPAAHAPLTQEFFSVDTGNGSGGEVLNSSAHSLDVDMRDELFVPVRPVFSRASSESMSPIVPAFLSSTDSSNLAVTPPNAAEFPAPVPVPDLITPRPPLTSTPKSISFRVLPKCPPAPLLRFQSFPEMLQPMFDVPSSSGPGCPVPEVPSVRSTTPVTSSSSPPEVVTATNGLTRPCDRKVTVEEDASNSRRREQDSNSSPRPRSAEGSRSSRTESKQGQLNPVIGENKLRRSPTENRRKITTSLRDKEKDCIKNRSRSRDRRVPAGHRTREHQKSRSPLTGEQERGRPVSRRKRSRERTSSEEVSGDRNRNQVHASRRYRSRDKDKERSEDRGKRCRVSPVKDYRPAQKYSRVSGDVSSSGRRGREDGSREREDGSGRVRSGQFRTRVRESEDRSRGRRVSGPSDRWRNNEVLNDRHRRRRSNSERRRPVRSESRERYRADYWRQNKESRQKLFGQSRRTNWERLDGDEKEEDVEYIEVETEVSDEDGKDYDHEPVSDEEFVIEEVEEELEDERSCEEGDGNSQLQSNNESHHERTSPVAPRRRSSQSTQAGDKGLYSPIYSPEQPDPSSHLPIANEMEQSEKIDDDEDELRARLLIEVAQKRGTLVNDPLLAIQAKQALSAVPDHPQQTRTVFVPEDRSTVRLAENSQHDPNIRPAMIQRTIFNPRAFSSKRIVRVTQPSAAMNFSLRPIKPFIINLRDQTPSDDEGYMPNANDRLPEVRPSAPQTLPRRKSNIMARLGGYYISPDEKKPSERDKPESTPVTNVGSVSSSTVSTASSPNLQSGTDTAIPNLSRTARKKLRRRVAQLAKAAAVEAQKTAAEEQKLKMFGTAQSLVTENTAGVIDAHTGKAPSSYQKVQGKLHSHEAEHPMNTETSKDKMNELSKSSTTNAPAKEVKKTADGEKQVETVSTGQPVVETENTAAVWEVQTVEGPQSSYGKGEGKLAVKEAAHQINIETAEDNTKADAPSKSSTTVAPEVLQALGLEKRRDAPRLHPDLLPASTSSLTKVKSTKCPPALKTGLLGSPPRTLVEKGIAVPSRPNSAPASGTSLRTSSALPPPPGSKAKSRSVLVTGVSPLDLQSQFLSGPRPAGSSRRIMVPKAMKNCPKHLQLEYAVLKTKLLELESQMEQGGQGQNSSTAAGNTTAQPDSAAMKSSPSHSHALKVQSGSPRLPVSPTSMANLGQMGSSSFPSTLSLPPMSNLSSGLSSATSPTTHYRSSIVESAGPRFLATSFRSGGTRSALAPTSPKALLPFPPPSSSPRAFPVTSTSSSPRAHRPVSTASLSPKAQYSVSSASSSPRAGVPVTSASCSPRAQITRNLGVRACRYLRPMTRMLTGQRPMRTPNPLNCGTGSGLSAEMAVQYILQGVSSPRSSTPEPLTGPPSGAGAPSLIRAGPSGAVTKEISATDGTAENDSPTTPPEGILSENVSSLNPNLKQELLLREKLLSASRSRTSTSLHHLLKACENQLDTRRTETLAYLDSWVEKQADMGLKTAHMESLIEQMLNLREELRRQEEVVSGAEQVVSKLKTDLISHVEKIFGMEKDCSELESKCSEYWKQLHESDYQPPDEQRAEELHQRFQQFKAQNLGSASDFVLNPGGSLRYYSVENLDAQLESYAYSRSRCSQFGDILAALNPPVNAAYSLQPYVSPLGIITEIDTAIRAHTGKRKKSCSTFLQDVSPLVVRHTVDGPGTSTSNPASTSTQCSVSKVAVATSPAPPALVSTSPFSSVGENLSWS